MASQFYERNTSGMNADRFMAMLSDESTVNTMQRHYWTAKQFIRTKLGRKEDEHLEASDIELDTCLNLYRSVHSTSLQLVNNVDNYANFLLDETLVQNVLGKYLKEKGKIDKSESIGRILIAVGRSLLFSSHRLNSARIRVSTFFNKLSVFVERAIGDCAQTIEAVQMCRTEYRGSLMWMKKTSEELDPEVYGSVEKFREAQGIVKNNKQRLDQLKMDTLQKVDLLSASRSNLLSYVLTHYQTELYEYYQKTARAYETLAENISCYNNYDFEILSHLATGTNPAKSSSKQSDSDGNENELKNLLFGRDSPLLDAESNRENSPLCDSPLIDEQEMGNLLEIDSGPATTSTVIGTLPTLFTDTSPVPAIQPPSISSNKENGDMLKWFGEQKNSKQDWESLLLNWDNQHEDNLL